MSTRAAWNLTIDNSSPMVFYLPHVDNDPSSTWARYDPVSGFYKNDGETLLANSSYVTWSSRSSIQLDFFGSAIYLYGEANCTYDVAIDNVLQPSPSPNGSLLASFPGLTLGKHVLSLKPRPNGSSDNGFAFGKALVTLESSPGEADRDVYDSRNSSIAYSGSWQEVNNSSIPSTLAPAPYHQSDKGSFASLAFHGDTVVVEGPLGWNFSQYGVVLDDDFYSYNGSSGVVVGNTVLFYATGLDPNKAHTILLENRMGGYNSTLGLNSITVFGSQGRKADPSEYTTKPTIVPILAAVMAVIIILQFLGVGLYMRRLRQRGDRETAKLDLEATKSGKPVELTTLPNVTSTTLGTDSKTEEGPKVLRA